MRFKIVIFLILFVLILAGCKEDKKEYRGFYNKIHTDYLQKSGWNAERFASETKYAAGTLKDYKEHVNTIRTDGQFDLTPFLDKDVIETGYVLKEKTDLYNQIVAYILESGGEVIGGYLEFNHEVVQPDGVIQVNAGQTTPMFNSNEKEEQSIIGHIIKKVHFDSSKNSANKQFVWK